MKFTQTRLQIHESLHDYSEIELIYTLITNWIDLVGKMNWLFMHWQWYFEWKCKSRIMNWTSSKWDAKKLQITFSFYGWRMRVSEFLQSLNRRSRRPSQGQLVSTTLFRERKIRMRWGEKKRPWPMVHGEYQNLRRVIYTWRGWKIYMMNRMKNSNEITAAPAGRWGQETKALSGLAKKGRSSSCQPFMQMGGST